MTIRVSNLIHLYEASTPCVDKGDKLLIWAGCIVLALQRLVHLFQLLFPLVAQDVNFSIELAFLASVTGLITCRGPPCFQCPVGFLVCHSSFQMPALSQTLRIFAAAAARVLWRMVAGFDAY